MPHNDAMEIAGAKVQVLVSSRETAGRYSICRIETTGPGCVPAHAHNYEDVCLFVEEGEFHFDLAGTPSIAPRGSLIFIPRGMAYRIRTELAEAGRLLLLAYPGGVDLLFHDVSAAQGRPLEPILEKHGITLLSQGLPDRTPLVRK